MKRLLQERDRKTEEINQTASLHSSHLDQVKIELDECKANVKALIEERYGLVFGRNQESQQDTLRITWLITKNSHLKTLQLSFISKMLEACVDNTTTKCVYVFNVMFSLQTILLLTKTPQMVLQPFAVLLVSHVIMISEVLRTFHICTKF